MKTVLEWFDRKAMLSGGVIEFALTSPYICPLFYIEHLMICHRLIFLEVVSRQMNGLLCCSWIYCQCCCITFYFQIGMWYANFFYFQPMNQDIFKSPPFHQVEAARDISPSAASFATFRSTFPEHSPNLCTQSQVRFKLNHYIIQKFRRCQWIYIIKKDPTSI